MKFHEPPGAHVINLKDIHSLSDFQRNAASIVGIQRGLQGMYDGTGEDAEDAFASLERELGIAEQA